MPDTETEAVDVYLSRRGQTPEQIVEVLNQALEQIQIRNSYLAGGGSAAWHWTHLWVLNAAEVLEYPEAAQRLDTIARIGRKARYRIQLVGVSGEGNSLGARLVTLASFGGSAMLRAAAGTPGSNVGLDIVSPVEYQKILDKAGL